MPGLTTNGLSLLSSLSGVERVAVDTEYTNGQNPQTAAATTQQLAAFALTNGGAVPVGAGGVSFKFPNSAQLQGTYNPATIAANVETFTPAVSMTISNIGATATSITNPTIYPFMNAVYSAGGVIDTTHFSYPSGAVGPFQWWSADMSGMTPQAANSPGRFTVEFVANTSQMEVKFRGTGSGFLDVIVDGVKVWDELGGAQATKTAQAGGASTITFATTDNATNGYYNQQYVYIAGGTGVGQRGKVASYVGATKVATMVAAWGVAPDATSTYIISPSPYTIMNSVSGSYYFPKITFGGDVRPHLVRIVSNEVLTGIYVDSSGTITKPRAKTNMKLVMLGDSFAYGVTPNGSLASQNFGYLLAQNLGMTYESLGVGGTGYIANSSGASTTYAQRTIPPANSWIITNGNASGGTFTLTQSGLTTGTIAYNAAVSVLQTALNTTFGAGNFIALTTTFTGGYNYLIIATGASNLNTLGMTIQTAGLTGATGTPGISQYTGDLDAVIPYTKSGAKAPFLLIIEGSGNDTAYSGQLAAASQALFTGLAAKYPQATIVATGLWMNNGPFSGTALTMQSTLQANAASYLPQINGQTAFLSTFNSSTGVGYLNGTTTVATAAGVAGVNTDIDVGADSTHPTLTGHYLLADVLTSSCDTLLLGY